MTDGATGSDYVTGALEREGVETVFGLVGEGNAHLMDAVNGSALALRTARHEQGAVTMADGYARATGRVGVVTLTHGPGVTNGATGLAIADRDGVPLVVLVGDTGILGRETSLQYLDHVDFTRPITAYGTRVEEAAALPDRLRAAFAAARSRRGPVLVELPRDVQAGAALDEDYAPAQRAVGRLSPDPAALDRAAAVLDAADKPLILAGGGAAASGAAAELETLAERLGAPIATTFFAKGLLPETHPLVSGITGTFMTPASAAMVPHADALLAVGARLSGKTTRYGDLWADAAVVQVDIDPTAIGTHREPDVAVVGDAGAALDGLADRVTPHHDRTDRVRERIAAADDPRDLPVETAADRIDPRALTVELADRFPDGTVVTVGSGNNTGFPAVFHRMTGGGRMLVNGNFGSMGYSLPAALGAAVADPDRPVLCYTGDGALLMVLQALETAAREALPVAVCVYNDAAYGIIRHRQRRDYGRETASTYESPDFGTVATGLGVEAVTVRGKADLEPVEEWLAAPSGPILIDGRVIPDVTRPGFPPY